MCPLPIESGWTLAIPGRAISSFLPSPSCSGWMRGANKKKLTWGLSLAKKGSVSFQGGRGRGAGIFHEFFLNLFSPRKPNLPHIGCVTCDWGLKEDVVSNLASTYFLWENIFTLNLYYCSFSMLFILLKQLLNLKKFRGATRKNSTEGGEGLILEGRGS